MKKPPGHGGVLYLEVKRRLIADIESGAAMPGSVLPNESELARRFEVSIGTLRRAVDELVADHILVRHQGKGTFVGRVDRDRFMFQFFKIVAHDGAREVPDLRFLAFGKSRADASEAKALGVAVGASVLRIENLLSLRGRPVIHDRIVLDQTLFEGLTRKQFVERPGTIYEMYQTAFGITVVGTEEKLRAERADPVSAELLGLEADSPVLYVRRIARTFEQRPVEYRVSAVDTREVEYFSPMSTQS